MNNRGNYFPRFAEGIISGSKLLGKLFSPADFESEESCVSLNASDQTHFNLV